MNLIFAAIIISAMFIWLLNDIRKTDKRIMRMLRDWK